MSDYLRDRLTAAVGNHYLIESELGRGGMAAVFGALDVRLNRRVAIKVLPPEHAFNANVKSRFLREAQMAAQLTHPHIVPIYTVDERDGLVLFVMALVDGESVARRLARDGALPVEDARTIVGAVADALDYAHRHGVIHRDIKPDNILLDRLTGRAMVMDFGIARAAAEEQRLTVTGMAVGTPAYMSPEQALGERDVDPRSDIYSLGIVAYQMLAGETPFRATNTPAMLMKHVSEPPPPLRGRRPDAPSGLVYAIERALAKRPEDRWPSAAAFRDAVLDRSAHRAATAPEPSVARNYPPGHQPAVARPPVSPPVTQPEPAPSRPPRAPLAIPEPSRMYPPGYPEPAARESERRLAEQGRDAEPGRYVEGPDQRVARRIAAFRRKLIGYGGVTFMLFVINIATTGGDPPWFIFPALGMMVALLWQLGALWGDGVRLRDIFLGPVRRDATAIAHVQEAEVVRDQAALLATPDILAGPHGPAIRRAAGSQAVVVDLLRRMTPREREMLPKDLETTVKALVDRVASLATTLHRLDADANGGSLATLDERIQRLRGEPESTDRERRLALLERQRSTLHDLLERRTALLTQMESASLALDTLKLDLVRFRSAGVASALEDVTSATREARAVSRDIGHMLDAQDELRRL